MSPAGDGTPIDMTEATEIALGVAQGKVVMHWNRPRDSIVFEPQNAFEFAENLAREAHRARFPGERLPDDFSYLAQQLKARLTDDLRNRLVLRVRTMLPSLLETKDLNYASMQIVDTVFAAVDNESSTML